MRVVGGGCGPVWVRGLWRRMTAGGVGRARARRGARPDTAKSPRRRPCPCCPRTRPATGCRSPAPPAPSRLSLSNPTRSVGASETWSVGSVGAGPASVARARAGRAPAPGGHSRFAAFRGPPSPPFHLRSPPSASSAPAPRSALSLRSPPFPLLPPSARPLVALVAPAPSPAPAAARVHRQHDARRRRRLRIRQGLLQRQDAGPTPPPYPPAVPALGGSAGRAPPGSTRTREQALPPPPSPRPAP